MTPSSACDPPKTLDGLLLRFLAQGVCLILPGHRMPVPIPLDECLLTDGDHLLWGTGHTLYGPSRPQIGVLEFATWQLSTEGELRCEFFNQQGEVIARLVPLKNLTLPTARAERLRSELARHRQRISADASYAGRWARGFRELVRANARRP